MYEPFGGSGTRWTIPGKRTAPRVRGIIGSELSNRAMTDTRYRGGAEERFVVRRRWEEEKEHVINMSKKICIHCERMSERIESGYKEDGERVSFQWRCRKFVPASERGPDKPRQMTASSFAELLPSAGSAWSLSAAERPGPSMADHSWVQQNAGVNMGVEIIRTSAASTPGKSGARVPRFAELEIAEPDDDFGVVPIAYSTYRTHAIAQTEPGLLLRHTHGTEIPVVCSAGE